METLRIAFFCWESLYSIKVGGLAPATTGLAEALAKKHEVHFFTRGLPNQEKKQEVNNVIYHRCRFPEGNNVIEHCRNVCLAMVNEFFEEEKRGSFDILHFHDWHTTEALHILRDRPNVFTFHSTEYGRNGNKFGEWWEFKEISGKEWYSSLISKRITTVSNTLKNEVMWLYNVPEWKISVVPNGISPEKFKCEVDAGEVKKRYGIHPLAPLIFFIGRMTYQKGPDLLLEAVPEVLKHRWDAKFIFAGEGGMKSFLEQRARELGVQNSVKFLGYISDDEYIKLLNACDIVAIPSRNEPFGMVLLEAWSAERCVVATDVGGLSENIDNFENGIKVFLYPSSIAWGINYVINDAYGVRYLGKKGREKIDREFRWEVVAKKMFEVYKKCY